MSRQQQGSSEGHRGATDAIVAAPTGSGDTRDALGGEHRAGSGDVDAHIADRHLPVCADEIPVELDITRAESIGVARGEIRLGEGAQRPLHDVGDDVDTHPADGDIGITNPDLEQGSLVRNFKGDRGGIHGDGAHGDRMHPPRATGEFLPHRDAAHDARPGPCVEVVRDRLGDLQQSIRAHHCIDVVRGDGFGRLRRWRTYSDDDEDCQKPPHDSNLLMPRQTDAPAYRCPGIPMPRPFRVRGIGMRCVLRRHGDRDSPRLVSVVHVGEDDLCRSGGKSFATRQELG